MEANADIILKLREKMQRLIWLYEHEQDKVKQLELKIEALEQKLNENVASLKETEESKRKLQLAVAFKSGSSDARDAKIKIGRIVREIDKCIALLNN